ncbi:MAG: UDP-N-acetylglucosamine 1-carboxyvinyltransferase [Bacillota bacterium]|jgi:UDP-N-acetylglucosamine 1-carboxyvinyltransferase|nr:UDP-N-acetylglucosamine 1-carboxyvinyltransferase [Bacillota bacterium]HOB91075.1 UDP-N-acetylglucosamine 1-carboxyvinyltransferase [Bacillota bacterium]HPZ54201.1 UDP-N-acetylglucosamine 1-carboxyvinyltransferase [Bacillota bacterium]HQD18296.1 UDP-N-acetylglucosamine 1-carboxyvinyltransferase [Bacillota bacterium]
MRFSIVGGTRLSGTVKISGAKNSVLKLMAMSLMANDRCVIRNVPRILDVQTMKGVIEALGARVEWHDDVMEITPPEHLGTEAPEELVRGMRASIQIMGPLLAKVGEVHIAQPGGCSIGHRPVDFHLRGFRAMGAEVEERYGYMRARADKLKGATVFLDFPSVGATENLMAAAALAEGTTVICNAAREPEIVDQQNFLNLMGAKVRGAGTGQIVVEGVKELAGVDYTVIPDRIEAGTMMVAAAITGGHVTLQDVEPDHLGFLVAKLREMGVSVEISRNQIDCYADRPIRGATVRSMPYPGFATDLQPSIAALASVAEGCSVLIETIYSNRFHYLEEMRKMGAKVIIEHSTAVIRGVDRLTGTNVCAPDLRGGAALVLCALAADGHTVVDNIELIDRGYEQFEQKLSGLGARIIRTE